MRQTRGRRPCPPQRNDTRSLNAWLLYGQAFAEWYKFERLANFRARELFRRAHDADPQWAKPLSGLSATYRESAIRGWGGSRENDLEAATALAEEAVAAGPEDPTALVHLAQVRMQSGRIEEAVAMCEKAVELAPYDRCPLCAFAYILPRAGEETRALSIFARSRKASTVPSGPNLANGGFLLHLAGRNEEAIEVLNESIERCGIADAHVRLAAAYFERGRRDEARAAIGSVLAHEPDATIGEYTRNLPFPDRRRRDWYRDLLRGAGLPDER